MALDLTIQNDQKIPVTITPVTATGKPATVDGVPTWTLVNGDATIAVAANGLTAELVSADTPGESNFLVEADADLGAGVETISDTIKLTVTSAKAVNLGLAAGPAVLK